MALAFAYTPWLLLIGVLVAAGATFWTYRRTSPPLSSGWRLALGALRFSALVLICFLLLDPIARQRSQTERPPVLAVLVDDSQSLRAVSGGETPDAARAALRPVLEAIGAASRPGEIRPFAFDQSVRALPRLTADSLSFQGSRTNLASALEAMPDELEDENLKGVVLISDGQYTAGRTPVRVADRYPVPIHTVTVGDTTRRRDVRIQRIATNDRAYLDTEVPVRIQVAAQGTRGEQTTVTLLQDGEPIDETTVQLPEGTGEIPVSLQYRPSSVGLQQLTARVTPLEDEATTQNNTQSTSLRVLETKRQVLLLGAAPSPTFASVRRILANDADTRLTVRVPRQDGAFYGGPLPDTLSNTDVVVLAGFPSEAVAPAPIERVASLIEDGTPAIFMLDHQTDVGAWAEQFGSALPARPPSGTALTEAPLQVTGPAAQHPVFRIEGVEPSLLTELPPLSVPAEAWRPSPDATVLAATAAPSEASRPALVVRRRAGRRSAAVLATDTWRWRTLPPSLQTADPLWPGLLSNLLRWVATQDTERQVRVQPVASTFEGGERIELTGEVYDASMAPLSDAAVEVTLTDSTGESTTYGMSRRGNGRYALEAGPLPSGTYRYRAEATRQGTTIGTDQGQFSVGQLRVEYQDPRANPVLMRRIAARSGGQAYRASDVDRLPADLAASSSFTAETVTQTTDTPLRRMILFLVLILLLLGGEWMLRKQKGLA